MRVERLILDLLFPRRCPLCGRISNGFCPACARKIPYVRQPYCFRCGRPLSDADRQYCHACQAHMPNFAQGRGLYRYADPVRASLYQVKNHNKREYLEYFAKDLAMRLGGQVRRWQVDALVPIPMHWQARRRRGYNQAEILASHLGKHWGLPVCPALQKVRKTAAQKEMDHRARFANVRGAFAPAPKFQSGQLAGRRVLLVDDIYTTGSTISEAARVLLGMGAQAVYFVTLCIVPEQLS